MTETLMVYSESGGATKTTTAVSLAASMASEGHRVVLVDLDPRAAATNWFGVQPSAPGLHVGAILAAPDPTGWAEEMAVPSGWFDTLRVVTSDRNVSLREQENDPTMDARLRASLIDVEADVIVIDCPNRQGGTLARSAFTAADTVVYAATPTTDGYDGVMGAQRSIEAFKTYRTQLGAPVTIREAGIVLGAVQETVMSRTAKSILEDLRDTGMLLTPIVPHRGIVQETRLTNEWFGNYRKGIPVADAYKSLSKQVLR